MVYFSWTCPVDLLKVGDLQVGASCFPGVPGCVGKMKVDLRLGALEVLLTPKTRLTRSANSTDVGPVYTDEQEEVVHTCGCVFIWGLFKRGPGVTVPSLQPES